MVQPSQRTMVVFVDYDNIAGSVGVATEEIGDWVMKFVRTLGQVWMAYIVVDARTVSEDIVRGLIIAGFSVLHSPKTPVLGKTQSKDSVDPMLIDLVHRQLDCINPAVTTIVLGSGDRDFVPMMATCRNLGKEVIVLGHAGVASDLRKLADQVIDLRTDVQRSINEFRRLLTDRGYTDYASLQRPDLVRLRDGLVSYLQLFQREYAAEKPDWLNFTFMHRGISRVSEFRQFSDVEIQGLCNVMIDSILDRQQGLEGRHYLIDYHHPFVSFALQSHPFPLPPVD